MNKAMLDELTADCKTPRDVEKIYSQMLQHMINRSLEAELQAHLGHERHGVASGNPRNGKTRMTTRDIESALVDLYGVTISHSLIAQVTDAVLDEARVWQTRPLEAIYPIVWLDGIVIKVQRKR